MDRGQISERILALTLQIISLLTGEDYMVVRKTGNEAEELRSHQGPITTTLHTLLQKRNKPQEILEITNTITELLTGEVPLRCQDVALYFSVEEWDYVEGHRDQYQDMMEGLQRVIPPDGSSKRNLLEKCPAPLFSQNYPEENVLENHKVEVVEDEEETDVMAEQQYGLGVRIPTERYPTPLCSQDCLESHQDGDLTDIKLQDEERIMNDQPYMSNMKEKIPRDDTTDKPRKNVVENFMLSLINRDEDEDIMQNSSGEKLNDIHPRLHSKNLSYNPPNNVKSLHDQLQIITSTDHKCGKRLQCGDCGKQFTQSSSLFIHRRIHTGEKPYTCSLCGKCFTRKSGLDQHERRHTGEKLYSCLVCGKCFVDKSNLVKHDRIHTGEKPYSCLECGKCFTNKSHLVLHQRSHTGEKPFSCSECDKCFTNRSHLVTHERIHTGEKPYLCSECGKCFVTKTKLRNHQKIHTGEKPFTCSECFKCYINKSDLVKHERIHTGEKPYSCSECKKCFTDKSSLVTHQRIHQLQ
ncbi:oocyte zinc finger protein XlCOF8.4-like isoform X2 [Dendrobates tinctorius]|uniref:oocyte zinc finger protein XlCOF8.4-like isoform X2 n=1 Tax=Dendrobates tinctorius TaxID=92724 RepID=UPI003CC937BE